LVSLQMPHYNEWKTQVEVLDQDHSLFANLIPLPREAILNTVSRPQGATVYVDGKPTGKRTPAKLTLSPGLHRIRLKLGGYQDSEDQVDLKASEEVSLNMSMTRIPSKKDKPVTTDGPGPTKTDSGSGWIIHDVKDR